VNEPVLRPACSGNKVLPRAVAAEIEGWPDIVMAKPAMSYLDSICRVKQ